VNLPVKNAVRNRSDPAYQQEIDPGGEVALFCAGSHAPVAGGAGALGRPLWLPPRNA